MYIFNKKDLRDKRRELRNNPTKQEKVLWEYLRNKRMGYKFRRQSSIGPYIVDFCCNNKRLIIELDGHQHNENKDYDRERTYFLNEKGYEVLRFWNHQVDTDFESVLKVITQTLNPTPDSLKANHPSL